MLWARQVTSASPHGGPDPPRASAATPQTPARKTTVIQSAAPLLVSLPRRWTPPMVSSCDTPTSGTRCRGTGGRDRQRPLLSFSQASGLLRGASRFAADDTPCVDSPWLRPDLAHRPVGCAAEGRAREPQASGFCFGSLQGRRLPRGLPSTVSDETRPVCVCVCVDPRSSAALGRLHPCVCPRCRADGPPPPPHTHLVVNER